MTTYQHVDAPIAAARERENVLVGGEIVRHSRLSRWIHWSVALTFFISLVSGMPIWMPLFGWMAVFVGGLEVARIVHPWAGIAFFILAVVEFVHWLGDMRFHSDERGWWRPSKIWSYMRYEDEPTFEVGKYNAGQKFFFYAVSLGAVALLASGIVMWFPLSFPRLLRELSILLHDFVFILFLIAIVFHIYLGTAAEPGTYRSMTRGTVTRTWAKLHHPGWFRDVSSGEKSAE